MLNRPLFITTGAQRVTNTPSFRGCPTITGSNKKTTKGRYLRSLNRKRRNSIITNGNCRTACLGWGGRTQFDFKKDHTSGVLCCLNNKNIRCETKNL